jgi:hypothetical protein
MNENELVGTLNEIQARVLATGRTPADNRNFKAAWRQLTSMGFKVRRHRSRARGNLTIRYTIERLNGGNFLFTNLRPDDGYRTLNGDCTTRALAFILEGTMTYREIEREQYMLAAQRRTRRNSAGTWELVATHRGYVLARLDRGVKRGVLAEALRGIAHPLISRSSGHAAAIDTEGRVRDTWDSRGGVVKAVIIHHDDMEFAKERMRVIGNELHLAVCA